MLGDVGWQELAIVLVIVVIIFGAGRLPEIGGAVGKSIKEFRAQSADDQAPASRSRKRRGRCRTRLTARDRGLLDPGRRNLGRIPTPDWLFGQPVHVFVAYSKLRA